MLRIGLISDTHGFLDPKVKAHFAAVDEIWHAGDIGDWKIIKELETVCPIVRTVWGNIDSHTIRIQSHEHLIWEVEGFKIWMTHIGGYPQHYPAAIKHMMNTVKPNIFICGHSHILKVMRDPAYQNMIVLNPGAAGVHGWHKVKTVLRFTLDNKKMTQLEAIELGKRGELKSNKNE